MVLNHSVLNGKKVGVIGFNARPLACSIKKCGGFSYVSDYWGDSDLDACSQEWVAVLSPLPGSRQRGSLENPVHASLSNNFLNTFEEDDFDHILIGSGFDDHSESLAKIERKFGITGNSPELMKNSRNREKLDSIAKDNAIHYPRYWIAENYEEAYSAVEKSGLPSVIRPLTSGGGAGIRKISGVHDLQVFYNRLQQTNRLGPRIIQEYISGIDVSASVLSTGSEAFTLSVQDQLIGLPSAGRHSDFVYCGNRIPTSINPEVDRRIRNVAQAIAIELKLKGSIGIDFVVTPNSEIWLLEVNPRFQGSLEMLERASEISVSELHVLACQGYLPKGLPTYRPTTKLILYANRDGVVPDLAKYPNTVDRSPKGVEVHLGDPICSIVISGQNGNKVFKEVTSIASQIQAEL